MFLAMTLGPAAIFCAYADRMRGFFKDTFVMFGRVPFAFYVAHFYLLHALSVLLGVMQGFDAAQLMTFPPFYPQGYGVSLPLVYCVWAGVVVVLYPFCRWVVRRQDALARLVAELRLSRCQFLGAELPQPESRARAEQQDQRRQQQATCGLQKLPVLILEAAHRVRSDEAAERGHGIDERDRHRGRAADQEFSRQCPERPARAVVADGGDGQRDHERGHRR